MDKKIKDEIEKMTEQTEWLIPPTVFPLIKEKKDAVDACSQMLNKLKEDIEFRLAARKILRRELWETIHREMPNVPREADLNLRIKEKRILKDDPCSDIGCIIDRIKTWLPSNAKFVGPVADILGLSDEND